MKIAPTFLPALAAALLLSIQPARATLVVQTQPYAVTNFSQTLSFLKWNFTNALTSVTLTINGSVEGSIFVFNPTGSTLSVNTAQDAIYYEFLGAGAPPADSTAYLTLTNTVPTLPFNLPSGASNSIIVNPTVLNGVLNLDLTPYAAYFTGAGAVQLDIIQDFLIGPQNLNSNIENLRMTGAATLTMVPEPSTYAMLALGAAGLFGHVIRRRIRK